MSTVTSRAEKVYDTTSKIKTNAHRRLNRYYKNPREAALPTYLLAHHIVWAPLFHVILAIFFSLALVALAGHYAAEFIKNSPQENNKAKLAFITLLCIAGVGSLVASVWWMSLYLRKLPYFEQN